MSDRPTNDDAALEGAIRRTLQERADAVRVDAAPSARVVPISTPSARRWPTAVAAAVAVALLLPAVLVLRRGPDTAVTADGGGVTTTTEPSPAPPSSSPSTTGPVIGPGPWEPSPTTSTTSAARPAPSTTAPRPDASSASVVRDPAGDVDVPAGTSPALRDASDIEALRLSVSGGVLYTVVQVVDLTEAARTDDVVWFLGFDVEGVTVVFTSYGSGTQSVTVQGATGFASPLGAIDPSSDEVLLGARLSDINDLLRQARGDGAPQLREGSDLTRIQGQSKVLAGGGDRGAADVAGGRSATWTLESAD